MVTSTLMCMEYYDTYWFANLVHNLILNPSTYLRDLEDFFGDLQYCKFLRSYPKFSALHLFIKFALETVMYQEIDDVVEDELINNPSFFLWVEKALLYHKIPHITFHKWREQQGKSVDEITDDLIVDYHNFLLGEGSSDNLFDQMTREVFFLMFLNRNFLRMFNGMISGCINRLTMEEVYPEERAAFRQDGILKRTRIPAWAKRAVFYRDRGRCSLCASNISGLVNITNNRHFDHIVPLGQGGINDISNLQLLCEDCNRSKGMKNSAVSKKYEQWYAL